jgi:hypothetical protein
MNYSNNNGGGFGADFPDFSDNNIHVEQPKKQRRGCPASNSNNWRGTSKTANTPSCKPLRRL